MKKTIYFLFAAFVFTACNNEGETNGTSNDSLSLPADSMTNPSTSDPNNRNTSVYDTSARTTDTASQERMRQRMQTDSGRR